MISRTVIEKSELTENLIHKVAVSSNEERVYLIVEYMEGHFVIEKTFKNNFTGLEMMRTVSERFDTEEKIREYLNLDGRQ